MKLFSLYRVELRRLALSKAFWGTAVLCLCAPLLGYSVYMPCASDIMSCIYIANPVLAGTTTGAILWAALAVFESGRLHRSSVNVLTDSVASPVLLSAAKMLSMMTLSAIVTIICSLLYFPFTQIKMEYLFMAAFYFDNFFVFMLPTWWISILFAQAFYQLTCSMELSAVFYAAVAYFSFSRFAEDDYFMRWINPRVFTYSDGFVSAWFLRVGLYSRIIWVGIGLGVWLISLLCIRKYQKNIMISFLKGLKKVYIPVLAIFVITVAVWLWINQPFVDHGSKDAATYFSTQIVSDDSDAQRVGSVYYSVTAIPETGKLRGTAEYRLMSPYDGESVFLLNPGYQITGITYDGEEITFRTENSEVDGKRRVFFSLPEVYGKALVIGYEGIPSTANCADYQVLYSVDENYITLGGVGLFPWTNNYVKQGDVVIDITIPGDLTPFLNYERMENYVDNKDGTKTWTAYCDAYVINFTAGNYVIDNISTDNLNIDFAYGSAYQTAVEDYDVKMAIVDVFDYCSNHYGDMDSSDNRNLLLMQVSSMYGGGIAYGGMVQWFEDVLAPNTLSDPARGASATDVFIHEMVHNWWGDLGLICETGELWTSEGLTVYSTYRIIKEKYGELYARKYYIDEWQRAVEEQDRDFYNRHPEYLAMLPEKYQAQLNAKNSSVNWYRRMPLMILKAEELVGGEDKMDEILQRMYADRDIYSGMNPHFTFEDFLDYCGLEEEDLRLE